MLLITMILSIYSIVNNQQPVDWEEIPSSMFSWSCAEIRRKCLIGIRLAERLPSKKENILSGKVMCQSGDRAMGGIVLPDEAGSHD
jgi:hypothetical protein